MIVLYIFIHTDNSFSILSHGPLSTDRSEAFAGVNLEEKQKSLSRTASPAKLVSRNFRVPRTIGNMKIFKFKHLVFNQGARRNDAQGLFLRVGNIPTPDN